MNGDERIQKYKLAVKQRDERIADLKASIENVVQKKNAELAAMDQKMQFIMDEKDKKIKVKYSSEIFNQVTTSLATSCPWRWGGQKRRRCSTGHCCRGQSTSCRSG